MTFLDTREPWPEPGRASVSLDVPKPTPGEQHAAWRELLGDAAADHPARLAGHFNFNGSTIRAIATGAAGVAGDRHTLGERLWRESLHHARPALDQLAQALEPKATWEDLELPATETQLLRQRRSGEGPRAVYDEWGFRDRMNRGLGISVLFAERAAPENDGGEVVANELGLLLYCIDLSAVVSESETEKTCVALRQRG